MTSQLTSEPTYVYGSGESVPTDESPLKLIVDTDTGVDDAAAIAWLLSLFPQEVEILGIARDRMLLSREARRLMK